MTFPYWVPDPARCPYFDDLSDCPSVQNDGHCDLNCGALVTIRTQEDENDFNDWLEELGYGVEDFL